MENEFVNKVLEGKVSPEEIAKVEAALSEAGQKKLRETIAIREQRKAEEERLAKAKKENDEREAKRLLEEEEKAANERKAKEEREKARSQKISEAKTKFFTEYNIPVEQQSQYATFNDSGSEDPNVILSDLKKTYAALNSDALIEAQRKLEEKAKAEAAAAAKATIEGAPSVAANPAGNQPDKYSERVKKIAQESNI